MSRLLCVATLGLIGLAFACESSDDDGGSDDRASAGSGSSTGSGASVGGLNHVTDPTRAGASSDAGLGDGGTGGASPDESGAMGATPGDTGGTGATQTGGTGDPPDGAGGGLDAGGSAGAGGLSRLGAEHLYDPAILATFELTIPETCRAALEVAPKEYCEGALTYRPPEGESLSFSRVGIRLKGMWTLQTLAEKPSFKVKLDEYVEGERLFGVRRITLNGMTQDPSMAHEVVGYTYFRATGVAASFCNYARVEVDGEYYGLYANLETADDEFAEHRFKPAPGNLFDTSDDYYFVDLTPDWLPEFELETNKTEADTSDLEALIAAANAPDESCYAEVGKVLDWNEALMLGAAQAIIADWDGYFGAANNYKVYHELQRDRFILIPWGIDQTFGTAGDVPDDPLAQLEYAFDHSTSNRDNGLLFRRCWVDASCRADYLAHVETALTVWNSQPLIQTLDAALALTAQARAEDTRRPYGDEQSKAFVDALRTFLTDRGSIVATQLAEFRQHASN